MSGAVLIFEVDGRRCGVLTSAVSEVVRAAAIQPLDGAPRGVEGVVDVRGDVLPVISMRARLGLTPRPLESSEYFLLAMAGARRVALRVDRVLDLTELDIHSADSLGLEQATLLGVARLPDGLIFIHDLGACLDASEERLLDALLTTRTGGHADDGGGGAPGASNGT